MDGANLLMIVIRREMEAQYLALLNDRHIQRVFSVLCEGTAGRKLLDLLGLEDAEKLFLCAMTSRHRARRVMREMVTELGINLPGNGIAVNIPVGSVGGASGMDFFLKDQYDETSEVRDVEAKRNYPYDLLIAIAQRGNVEAVMSAARTAGARGGTILHAKGTGAGYAEKFLGVSIAEEKEMILIVARHEQKDAIMRAIMDKAGVHTEARAVVFSVPVESVAGLKSVMRDEDEDEDGAAQPR